MFTLVQYKSNAVKSHFLASEEQYFNTAFCKETNSIITLLSDKLYISEF